MPTFVQLTTCCVLSWSTVAEETCCTGSSNIKPGRSALMTWGLNYLKVLHFHPLLQNVSFLSLFSLSLDSEMVCSNVFCHTPHPSQTGSAQRLEIQGTAASWTLCIFMRVQEVLKFSKPIQTRVNSLFISRLDSCAHQQSALGGKMNDDKAADGNRNTTLSSVIA